MIDPEVIVAFIGLVGTVGSAVIAHIVTRSKARKELTQCKERYLDDKLREIIDIYQKEVKNLREDLKKLTKENALLREEVLDLKNRLLIQQSHRDISDV